jgi:hypothetical protein
VAIKFNFPYFVNGVQDTVDGVVRGFALATESSLVASGIASYASSTGATGRAKYAIDPVTKDIFFLTESGEVVCWEDLQCPPEAFNAAGVASPPTLDSAVVPGTWLFSGTTENNLAVIRQLPHRWKAGTLLKPHVHWEKTTTEPGEVMWQWCYTIANVREVFPAYSVYFDGTNAAPHLNTVRMHAVDTFPSVDMVGKRESCMICLQVRRLPTHVSDTYPGNARFLEFDIHYMSNKLGTTIEYPGADNS